MYIITFVPLPTGKRICLYPFNTKKRTPKVRKKSLFSNGPYIEPKEIVEGNGYFYTFAQDNLQARINE